MFNIKQKIKKMCCRIMQEPLLYLERLLNILLVIVMILSSMAFGMLIDDFLNNW